MLYKTIHFTPLEDSFCFKCNFQLSTENHEKPGIGKECILGFISIIVGNAHALDKLLCSLCFCFQTNNCFCSPPHHSGE